MFKKATTEEKLLLFGYGAIVITYTLLFAIKFRNLNNK